MLNATLTVRVADKYLDGSLSPNNFLVSLYGSSDDGWSDTAPVTAPASVEAPALDTWGVSNLTYYSTITNDVTAFVQEEVDGNKLASFVFKAGVSSGANYLAFFSKEADETNRPVLTVQMGASDTNPPVVVIGSPSTNLAKTGPVSYPITVIEDNPSAAGLSAGGITLNRTGSANATVLVNGSGTNWTVTLTNLVGDGTLGISVAAGAVSDTAGNTNAGVGPSATFSVDNTRPEVVSILRKTPPGQAANTNAFLFQVTFSEAVANVATNRFAVTPVGASTVTGVVTSVSGGPIVYDVLVTLTGGSGPFRLDVP